MNDNVSSRLPASPLTSLEQAERVALDLVVYLRQEIAEREDLRAEWDKLQAFKEYVHCFLDEMCVPSNPEPQETARSGCRIGARLRYVFARIETLEAAIRNPPPDP
jgi:hypothetical protein